MGQGLQERAIQERRLQVVVPELPTVVLHFYLFYPLERFFRTEVYSLQWLAPLTAFTLLDLIARPKYA